MTRSRELTRAASRDNNTNIETRCKLFCARSGRLWPRLVPQNCLFVTHRTAKLLRAHWTDHWPSVASREDASTKKVPLGVAISTSNRLFMEGDTSRPESLMFV